MTNGLKNKVVLITGGGRGIGAAAAQLFADVGAKVLITSRTEAELRETAMLIEQAYPKATVSIFKADISKEEDVDALFGYADVTYGPVDVLVNNAAIIEMGNFLDMKQESWDQIMNVNVRGAILCARHAFEHMTRNRHGGSIVNIGSLAGIQYIEKFLGMSAYCVSKYAITGLTEALAMEGKHYNIRVNCVAPGATDTAMLRKAAPGFQTQTQPADVAKVILWLADSTQSGILTGSTIPVLRDEI